MERQNGGGGGMKWRRNGVEQERSGRGAKRGRGIDREKNGLEEEWRGAKRNRIGYEEKRRGNGMERNR
jgi:hypothetical protein